MIEVVCSDPAASQEGRSLSASPRAGDVPSCHAATALAKELLHWYTTRDLATMCTDAWSYEQNQISLDSGLESGA